MYCTPPISVEDFYRGAREVLRLPENEPQVHVKPRVSSISRDAREIAYMMANTPRTNDERGDLFLSAEQGRLMEEGSIKALAGAGLYVMARQMSLPREYPLTGHPDGWLTTNLMQGTLHSRLSDGKQWGFEHKHFGRWAYEDIMKKGLIEAAPDIIGQVALYGDALGWDRCMVVVTSQDASSVRSDMTRNKKAKNPNARWADDTEADPKVMIFGIDIEQAKFALVPALLQRAAWFSNWYATDGDPQHVAWEHEPGKWWGWDYSQWGDLVRSQPQGTLHAPALPWEDK